MAKSGLRQRVNAEAIKVAAVLAAVAACDSGEAVAPPVVPLSLAVAPDSAVLTYLGETVRFTARVTGGTGSEAGTVRWESTDRAVVTVDGSGLVTARGNGTAEVRASLGGVSDAAPVRVAQRASGLRVFGDGQRALPGLSLPSMVGVAVRDGGDRPVVGAVVRFAVTAGGGTVDPDSAVSDGSGLAAVAWTVGETLGEQRLVASVVDGPEAEITAKAVGPDSAVAAVELQSGGGERVGLGQTRLVLVRVADGAGRPVGGALVRFSPGPEGGSVQPDSVRSDSSGLASASWMLGPAVGDHTLVVLSGEARLDVTATALDPASTVATIEAPSWGGETAGTGQRIEVEVRLRDGGGRSVAGAFVTFLPGPSGGSVKPDSARSDGSGFASSVWTLGPNAGDYTLVVASGRARLELAVTAVDPDSVVARVVPWSGDRQWGIVGHPLPELVVVQTLDEARRLVPGALVTFMPGPGSGSADPDSVRSDSLGLASTVWTLGASIGDQRLAASVAGGARLDVTAAARPDAGVCRRTRAVIEELLARTGLASCADVTRDHLASLRALVLSQRNITSLRSGDFAGLPALRFLLLNENRLTELPPDVFAGLDSLTQLDLSQNQLETLPPGVLAGLPHLFELRLRNNRLTEIPPDLAGLTGLARLDLSLNPLAQLPSSLFAGWTRLETLYLTDIGIEQLPPEIFKGLSGLKHLALAQNRLSRLSPGIFDDLSSLEVLWLPANQLTELPPGVFANLPNLRNLYLAENELGQLAGDAFSGLSHLRGLYLERNELTELPPGIFSGLSSLRFLRMNDNKLAELPPDLFRGLSRLYLLELSGNPLSELPLDLFDGLGSLETLRMARGSLYELPPGIFDGLSSLTELDLRANALTVLPPGVFLGLSHLEELDLWANPGAPFPLGLELTRVDAADVLAPGPASVVLRVRAGAPLPLRIPVTLQGGTASGESFTVTAGDTASAPLEVRRSAGSSGPTYLSPGLPPTLSPDFRGLDLVVGEQMVLFAPSGNRTPVVAKGFPLHWLQAGARAADVELGGHFSDPDGDALAYAAESHDTGVVEARVEGGVLELEPLSEGSTLVEVTAADPDGLRTTLDVPVTVARSPDPGDFHIELIFGEGFTEAEEAEVRRAAARWMELITGDLPDVPFEDTFCMRDRGPRLAGTIDDLMIEVSIQRQGGGILASAGTCGYRQSGLPFMGGLRFNRDAYPPDAPPTGPSSMYVTALHEIGHVLGIGGRGWYDLLREPTYEARLDTHFPGPLAVEAFNEAGGRSYTGGKVPAENDARLGANFHWRMGVLGGELMVAAGGTALSAITLQALADLGYEVDVSGADPYELYQPDKIPTADAVSEEASWFADDLIKGSIFIVDENGEVVRIIRN
ncbi:leucine-rich repeat domain-containing protein [Candidatus Palauibacter sp.]|uniref:leucine-rich repeat domain-containing protein n=1 Tax=Candidatus Palauibacter sp. TaxID=3101350 RepID=UPI003B5302B7